MAPAEVWDADFRYAIDTYDAGVAPSPPTTPPPSRPATPTADGGEIEAVSAGVAGWPEDILRMGRDVCEGRLVRDGAWLLFPAPTVADPSRAPEGHHTVKILGMQPYDPGGEGPQRVGRPLREEIAAVHLDHLQRVAAQPDRRHDPRRADRLPGRSRALQPAHVARHLPRRRPLARHSGALRPAPGWAQHRMPIPGLYQTGGTTHPGGSVTGGPGATPRW